MKLSKKLQAFVDEAKQTDAYWAESAKLEFALVLEQQRRAAGLSYAYLAKKMGTSAAYISKVFRGDTNLTIESMVKLARATGGNLMRAFWSAKLQPRHTAVRQLPSRFHLPYWLPIVGIGARRGLGVQANAQR